MAKNVFDQFSKQFLEEILSPLGSVESSHEVSGETQLVDVYFIPNSQPTIITPTLSILDRIIQTPCLIEPSASNPPPTKFAVVS